jgi:hypothetical protein
VKGTTTATSTPAAAKSSSLRVDVVIRAGAAWGARTWTGWGSKVNAHTCPPAAAARAVANSAA